jgi:hypothetical protein
MTEPSIQPAGDYSEAILQSTIERLKARGDARRFSCMSLPAPLFNDLCARLLDRTIPVRHTAEWLAGQLADAPTRSSVERFAATLFDEYRLCELDRDSAEARRFAEAAAGGDPDAMQMALNERLTQLLAGEALRAKSGESIDTKRLGAIIFGARTVAKNAMDKRAVDVRIESLQAQIRLRDTAIQLYEQRLQKLPERLKAIEDKLAHAEKGGTMRHPYGIGRIGTRDANHHRSPTDRRGSAAGSSHAGRTDRRNGSIDSGNQARLSEAGQGSPPQLQGG